MLHVYEFSPGLSSNYTVLGEKLVLISFVMSSIFDFSVYFVRRVLYLYNFWTLFILVWFDQGVTYLLTSTWFILEPHRTERKVYSDIICNIHDYRLLGGSHTILHTVTHFIQHPCWLEPSTGSSSRDLKNLFCLLPGLFSLRSFIL